MKNIIMITLMTSLLIACGSNESGKDGNSSALTSLNSVGISITGQNSNQFNNVNQFNNGFGSEILSVTCSDGINSAQNSNITSTRLTQLDSLLRVAQQNSTITLNGVRYQSQNVQSLLGSAIQALLQFGGSGRCPGPILSQAQVAIAQ